MIPFDYCLELSSEDFSSFSAFVRLIFHKNSIKLTFQPPEKPNQIIRNKLIINNNRSYYSLSEVNNNKTKWILRDERSFCARANWTQANNFYFKQLVVNNPDRHIYVLGETFEWIMNWGRRRFLTLNKNKKKIKRPKRVWNPSSPTHEKYFVNETKNQPTNQTKNRESKVCINGWLRVRPFIFRLSENILCFQYICIKKAEHFSE